MLALVMYALALAFTVLAQITFIVYSTALMGVVPTASQVNGFTMLVIMMGGFASICYHMYKPYSAGKRARCAGTALCSVVIGLVIYLAFSWPAGIVHFDIATVRSALFTLGLSGVAGLAYSCFAENFIPIDAAERR